MLVPLAAVHVQGACAESDAGTPARGPRRMGMGADRSVRRPDAFLGKPLKEKL